MKPCPNCGMTTDCSHRSEGAPRNTAIKILTQDEARGILCICHENERRFGEKDFTMKKAMETILALYDENERLKGENALCGSIMEKLARQVEDTTAENARLKDEVGKCHNSLTFTANENARLREENGRASNEVSDWVRRFNAVCVDRDAFIEKNEALRADNTRLREENADLYKRGQDLYNEHFPLYAVVEAAKAYINSYGGNRGLPACGDGLRQDMERQFRYALAALEKVKEGE